MGELLVLYVLTIVRHLCCDVQGGFGSTGLDLRTWAWTRGQSVWKAALNESLRV